MYDTYTIYVYDLYNVVHYKKTRDIFAIKCIYIILLMFDMLKLQDYLKKLICIRCKHKNSRHVEKTRAKAMYYSDHRSDGGSIENSDYYRERWRRGKGLRRGHTRGGDIYCVDLPRVEGMNLRRDVRAGVQRRRRRGIRNRGRNARTPFRFVSRVEAAFTHGRPLGPYLPTVVAAESSRSSFHLLRCLLFVSRRVHRHAPTRADFIPVRIATEVFYILPMA